MKYINNLLALDIKPIMVFDGCHLPSKKGVETARREYVYRLFDIILDHPFVKKDQFVLSNIP